MINKLLFGKYKGKDISDVPLDYLLWVRRNINLDKYGIKEAVLEALGEIESQEEKNAFKIIELENEVIKLRIQIRTLEHENSNLKELQRYAYRTLSKYLHPDKGGSHELQALLNDLFSKRT